MWLTACASVEAVRPDIAAKPLPSRPDEIALINELRMAYEVVDPRSQFGEVCFDGAGLRAFKSKSGQGYQDAPDPENERNGCIRFRSVNAQTGDGDLVRYMSAGFTLTDIYCQRFFAVAAASERNRNFGRTMANGVDTLVGSILTLSGAGRTSIGISNAAFGLIDDGIEAYDTAYLVGPDLAEVRRLVAAAQAQYRMNSLDTESEVFPSTYAGARAVIERYAGLCSYTGMKELVDTSVKDKTDELNEDASPTPSPTATPTDSANDPPGAVRIGPTFVAPSAAIVTPRG